MSQCYTANKEALLYDSVNLAACWKVDHGQMLFSMSTSV